MAEVTSSHLSLGFGLSNAAEYNASSEVVRDRGSHVNARQVAAKIGKSLDQVLVGAR